MNYFLKSILITLLMSSFLFAKIDSNVQIELNQLKTSQEYSEKLTNEKVQSLFAKALLYGQMGENEEAIKVYDEVVKRFEDSKDNSILENVARALYNKGVILGQMGENEEAIKVYDEVVKRFEDSKDNSILEKVASALINKIEMSLISNIKINEKDFRLYFNLIKDKKEELLKYKMLKILESSVEKTQEKEINIWKEKYKDISLGGWSFNELKTWAISFEDEVVKARLLRYIEIFENHNKTIEK